MIVAVMVAWSGGDRKNSLLPYIFSDYWNKGLNLFAIVRVLIMICWVAIIWSIISFIIGRISNLLDTKGETVARLFKSVAGYVVFLGTAYYTALYLGFDPATLLASVGVIGLAISIGAKDIISDVFGGISLVFEKVFQVGDTVEVDGVRGKVIELGARTLKLIDEEGNLRVLRNGEIHKITNLSNQKTASRPDKR